MRYKIKLTRSDNVFAIVDIPADFNLKVGDALLINNNYHEVKMIIRPTIVLSDINAKQPTQEEFNEAGPILVVSDSFLFSI